MVGRPNKIIHTKEPVYNTDLKRIHWNCMYMQQCVNIEMKNVETRKRKKCLVQKGKT